MTEKPWSRKYKQCVCCGKTKFKHFAKGLCSSCYMRKYNKNPKNTEKIKKTKSEWYKKQPKEKFKEKREKTQFDSKRQLTLRRDNFTCQKCGCTYLVNLVVHHLDGAGRNKKVKNNSLDNLQTLCRKCHANAHRNLLLSSRKSYRWSKHHLRCKGCKTSKKKHFGHGYCKDCYYKFITLKKKPLKKMFEWSRKYPQCINCGTTETKHEGYGLCRKCYFLFKIKSRKG